MRKLHIALVVSLLANLFLASVVVGGTAWLKTRHPVIAAGSLRIAGAELPLDKRRAFRAALRETRVSMRPTGIAAREARGTAAILLRQPVLDQAALATALGQLRTADFAMRTAMETRAIAFAATLQPEDRARLAQAMERRADGTKRAPQP